jgi:regulator of sigma E protease
MTVLFNYAYIILAVIALFGAAVFVHEYGHYWMARRRGLKVLEFSIGFGPKIFGWKQDGVDWSWRWIPAGGYVKLPQMITSEALEGHSEGMEKLPPITPLSKILVAFAGPFMNVVFGFAIACVIWYVGLPVAVNPPIIGHVAADSAEAKLGLRDGDRIVGVNGKPIASWEEVQEATVLARTNVLAVEIQREGVRHTYALTAHVNPIIGLKLLNLEPRDHPVIKSVRADSAAQAAGLKDGDVVVSFAKVPIVSREQFIKLIQGRPGEDTALVVKRADKEVALTVTPRLNPTTQKGLIGAEIGSDARIVYTVQRPGPTPWAQFSEVIEKTVSTFGALWHSKQTGVGAKDLSGPVGIFAMLAAQVNTDWRLALSFLVLLNLNLAVLNLLPIPVLDGGHIMMSLFEKVRGKPLGLKFVEYTTTAFAVLLISFMLYVSFYDVKRIPLFRTLFNSEVQVDTVPQPAPVAPAPAKP